MKDGDGITPQTPVPIGWVLSSLVVMFGAVWQGSRVYHQQQRILADLAALQVAVELGTKDRWTAADMERWIGRANLEVEIWSMYAEQRTGIPVGSWERFEFPSAFTSND